MCSHEPVKYTHEVDGPFLGMCVWCGEPVYDVEENGGVIFTAEYTGDRPIHGVCFDECGTIYEPGQRSK